MAIVQQVHEMIQQNPLMVFSKTYCPYCRSVKEFLKGLGAETKVVEIDKESTIRTEEMDKLAEWGIAAYHSGRWVEERESDAMESFARKGRNGAAVGYLTPNASGSSSCLNDADIARRVSWLKSIRDWQEEFVGNMSSREFVDTVTGDILSSRVFVFTPKGEVKNLPKGATVIDYAYQIHTDVGNKIFVHEYLTS